MPTGMRRARTLLPSVVMATPQSNVRLRQAVRCHVSHPERPPLALDYLSPHQYRAQRLKAAA